ncbi:telomere length regulation protein-domain-containing protein [Hyaloraphidium curvatum]|nr:telomere length regulation protein-domain-containing protein [Hyaloraphidium curvatum]
MSILLGGSDASEEPLLVESRTIRTRNGTDADLERAQVPAGDADARTLLLRSMDRIRSDLSPEENNVPEAVDAALSEPLDFLMVPVRDLRVTQAETASRLAESRYFGDFASPARFPEDLVAARTVFLDRHLPQHLHFLLVDRWALRSAAGVSSDVTRLLNAYFVGPSANPHASLSVLSAALVRGAVQVHSTVVVTAIELLSQLIRRFTVLDFLLYAEALGSLGQQSIRPSGTAPKDQGSKSRVVQRSRTLWSDCVDSLCAIPDRVAGASFGKSSDENLWHENFFARLALDLEHAVHSLSFGPRSTSSEGLLALAELVSKLARLNRLDTVFESCFPAIWKRVVGDGGREYLAAWNAVLGDVPELDRVVEAIFRALEVRVLARDTSGSTVRELAQRFVVPILDNVRSGDSTFQRLLCEKFLLQRTFSTAALRLIFAACDVRHLERGDRGQERSAQWTVPVAELLLRTWTSRDWIARVGDHQHKYVTCALLALLPYFGARGGRNGVLLPSSARSCFVSGFGQYLSATEPRIRTRGMVVGEEISKVVAAGFQLEAASGPTAPDAWPDSRKMRLDFGLADEGEVADLRALASESFPDAPSPTVLDTLFGGLRLSSGPSEAAARETLPGTSLPSRAAEVASDSDDDDDGAAGDEWDDLEPYDFDADEFPGSKQTAPETKSGSSQWSKSLTPPSTMAVKDTNNVKIMPPVYVRELLAYLRASSEDVTKQELALQHAVSVIRAMHDMDWTDHGPELALSLVRLDDSYELDDFDKLRGTALRETVSRGAKHVIPALVSAFYDRNFSLSQRLLLLDCLASAARDLSSLDDDPALDDPTLVSVSAATSKSLDGVPSGRAESLQALSERIAENTRRFSRKSVVDRAKKPPKPNRWTPHAEAAILPLIGRLGSRSNAWDPLRNGGSETPLLLDRLLMCATAMVWCSAHLLAMRRLCRELFDFAWSLRTLPSSARDADAASAEMDRSDVPATVALAITVAFSMLSQVSFSKSSSLAIFYDAYTDREVDAVAEWAMDLLDEGIGGEDHRMRASTLIATIRDILEARRAEVFGSEALY